MQGGEYRLVGESFAGTFSGFGGYSIDIRYMARLEGMVYFARGILGMEGFACGALYRGILWIQRWG